MREKNYTSNAKQPVIIEGISYESKEKAYRAYGTTGIQVYNHIKKYGSTFGEAVIACQNRERAIINNRNDLLREMKKAKKYEVFGRNFSTYKEICEYFKINYNTFNTILSKITELPSWCSTSYSHQTVKNFHIELAISHILVSKTINKEK